MKQRKLWKLIRTLAPKEIERFPHWLEGELYDKQVYVKKLARYLLHQPQQAPNDEQVWAELYPDIAYDDDRLRKLCGDLSRHLEEFLAIQAFRREKDKRDLYLLQELNQKQAPELFVKLLNKMERRLRTQRNHNSDFFRLLFEVEAEKQIFEIRNRKELPSPNPLFPSLFGEDISKYQGLNYAFDSWWLQEKLALITRNNLSIEQKSGIHIESILESEVIQCLSHHPALQNQTWINIYRNLYHLFKKEVPVDIHELVLLIRNKQQALGIEEIQSIWGLLLNFFIGELNISGSVDTARKIYILYDWGVEDQLIFRNNYLPPIHYKNIIGICLRVKDYALAWRYLHEFKSYLPPDQQEDLYYLRLALYYVSQKKYQEVIQTLSDRKFSIVTDEISARSYLLEAQYELYQDDVLWLSSQTDNLVRYIRSRKELKPQIRQSYLNRYRFFKRILHAYTEKDLRKVEKAVKKADLVNQPNWLLQKISERLELTAP